MLDIVMSVAFENTDKAIDIAFNICLWIGNRITDSCLSTEIHDSIEISVGEQHLHSLGIFQVHTDKTEPFFC